MDELFTIAAPERYDANLQLADPVLLKYYKHLDNRQMWLEGEIIETDVDIVKDIMLINAEDNDNGIAKQDRKPIVLYINSNGGDLYTTNMIIDVIRNSETPVYTVNMGIAYSGGLFILLAGEKRFAMPWSSALIHSGSGGSAGTFEQSQALSKQWEFEVKRLNEYVMERTNIDKRQMNKKKSTEWYVNGEDQKSLGIVDEMVNNISDIL